MTDNLIDKIKALRATSAVSTLRNLMPEIDLKVREGVSHEDIVATMYASGVDINLHTFRSALYRYRKQQRDAEDLTSIPVPSPRKLAKK